MNTCRNRNPIREPDVGPHLALVCSDYRHTGYADLRRARLADAAIHAAAASWAASERPDDTLANAAGGWN